MAKRKLTRRTLAALAPAAGAALTTSGAAAGEAQQRLTRETLRAAEQLLGIELTDAQANAALSGVANNAGRYHALRQIEVPLDTEPAIGFHAVLPGKRFDQPARRPKFSPVELPKFKSVDELAFASALQLGELIRQRKVTSVALTKMYLERLKRLGPKLLCVVTLTEEVALVQAEHADRELRAGRWRGPLQGVPCGVKDLFATRGIRTTWGAEPFREQLIDVDATVIQRLRQAGAPLLAKLSMGALALGGRWFTGMTRNPWQPDEQATGSSGSSAGSASATSAGLVGFSVGTETLGSIISPSSRCGVVGLRPTYGRISRYGGMALSWTMDKVGPICRTVEDCAGVLHVLAGPDGRDLTVPNVPFNWDAGLRLDKLRIGFVQAEFEAMTGERKTLYEQALTALRAAGAQLRPMELPKFAAANLLIILDAEASAAFDDITRNGRVDEIEGSPWPNSFRRARFIPAVEYLRAQRARTLLQRELDALMQQWDVFVTPAPGSQSLVITNLTGHPALCLPCGFLNGLPQSLMFTGGICGEAALLRAALAYEQATKWHTMKPTL